MSKDTDPTPGTAGRFGPDILTSDHMRGCQGREYQCTCGYDDAKDAEIERLRAELASMTTQCAEWQRLYFQGNPAKPHRALS